jgi:hypothetical protein
VAAAEGPATAPPGEAPVVTPEPKPAETEPSLVDKTRDLFEKPVGELTTPAAPPVTGTAAPEPKVGAPLGAPLGAREWTRPVNPNDRFAEPRLEPPQTLAPPIVPPMERPSPRVDMPNGGGAPRAEPQAPPPSRPATPTVLKSGVIEGMAYTLYSDGSIEAELAQGSMRFDSIPALRAYLRDIG